MKENFKPLSLLETAKLTKEKLIEYRRDLREYQLYNTSDEKVRTGIILRKVVHPVLYLGEGIKKVALGQRIHKISGKKKIVKQKNRPIIFAVTHIGKYDIEMVGLAIKKHYYLLDGDPNFMYRTFDGYFEEANGVVYVDETSDSDKQVSKETCIRLLNLGANIMWFIEGIWNFRENLPMLKCAFGVIEAAIKSNAIIVPVSIEQYGKNDKDFYINIGDNFYAEDYLPRDSEDKEPKIVAIYDLMDRMATLKYGIWKHFPALRKDIPEDYWEQYKARRTAEWPYLTEKAIKEREFEAKYYISYLNGKPELKEYVTPEKAFAHLKTIEPNMGNAFMFAKHKKHSKCVKS